MTIYLDSLIITNIYVNFFLIKALFRITHTKITFKGNLLGAVIGSITSIFMIFPIENNIFSLIVKLIFAFIIVFSVNFKLDIKKIAKLSFLFFGISFGFYGVITLICTLVETKLILLNNFTVYFDISTFALMVGTIISYVVVTFLERFLRVHFSKAKSYFVTVKIKGKTYSFKGICDSGNNLFDMFSGQPVVVCNSYNLYSEIFPRNDEEKEIDPIELIEKGARLTPYSTIMGNGFIPILKAEKLIISSVLNEEKEVDCYVGITQNKGREENAIFNPAILV